MASLDLLLHPVRLRILRSFAGRTLTTGALAAELADIPPASLYRHMGRLVDAGVLAVVGERRVRGALERTYELRLSAAAVSDGELAAMTVDDHRQAFTAFVAGLLGDFERYLAGGDVDLRRDGVTYSLNVLWLDDAEYAEMMREIDGVIRPRYANPPTPARRRRVLGAVVLPGEARDDRTE